MTNSHPDKSEMIVLRPEDIKTTGIDTLFISFNGEWKNLEWHSYFADLKKDAQERSMEVPGTIKAGIEWNFMMMPNGARGFEWILMSNDFTLKIGKWTTSKTRPNVMAEIRSEMLWRLGAEESCSIISKMLSEMGLEISVIKPSRADLCMDVLFPKSAWNKDLIDYAVSKGFDRAIYIPKPDQMKGITIGQGNMMVRMYDKGLEIKQKSKKFWMFDIWGIAEIPEDRVMLRIEFQMRREMLKDIKANTLTDFFETLPNIWAYCTKKWLKFEDNIGAHRDYRETMPWWVVVQDGYEKAQGASPAIRKHIMKPDMERLASQTYGFLISFMACNLELTNDESTRIKMEQVIYTFIDWLVKIGKTSKDLNEKIQERRTKFKRLPKDSGE
jgi:hypothetical protein